MASVFSTVRYEYDNRPVESVERIRREEIDALKRRILDLQTEILTLEVQKKTLQENIVDQERKFLKLWNRTQRGKK